VHDSPGGPPTASASVDFAAVALACSYQLAETVAAEAFIPEAVERHLDTPGPTLLRVLVLPGARKELGRPKLHPRDGWQRFCAFLGSEGAGS